MVGCCRYHAAPREPFRALAQRTPRFASRRKARSRRSCVRRKTRSIAYGHVCGEEAGPHLGDRSRSLRLAPRRLCSLLLRRPGSVASIGRARPSPARRAGKPQARRSLGGPNASNGGWISCGRSSYLLQVAEGRIWGCHPGCGNHSTRALHSRESHRSYKNITADCLVKVT